MKRLFLSILLIYLIIVVNGLNKTKKKLCQPVPKELVVDLKKYFELGVRPVSTNIWGSCINNCSVYITVKQEYIFVKENSEVGSHVMFRGEFEGLKAIRDTKTVIAPRPIVMSEVNRSSQYLVVEYITLSLLDEISSMELGSKLADMHLHNMQQKEKSKRVRKFGFHVITSCGMIPQNNTWTDDWITFFIENRMSYQIQLLRSNPDNIQEKNKILDNYWPRLKPLIPKFFEGIKVEPSLLHGDLWFGNTARSIDSTKPVVFDPAAFYGHHEYDISITLLFELFSKEFHDAYFMKIPKAKGFEKRIKLYQLFHFLNHWNHRYEGGYVEFSIAAFKELLKDS